MTAIINTINSIRKADSLPRAIGNLGNIRNLPKFSNLTPIQKRFVVLGLAALAISLFPNGINVLTQSLSDSYYGVTVYVVATLLAFKVGEKVFARYEGVLDRGYLKVPVGALMGTLPGCGGAILTVTQFTKGKTSFGAVVATLTATMGDAMFLLIARAPESALMIAALSMIAALVTGYLIDISGVGKHLNVSVNSSCKTGNCKIPTEIKSIDSEQNDYVAGVEWLAGILLIPAVVIALTQAFQIEIPSIMGYDLEGLVFSMGVMGAVLGLILYAIYGNAEESTPNEIKGIKGVQQDFKAAILNASWVSVWVILSFVGYEIVAQTFGFQAEGIMFESFPAVVPLLAILVGLIPGCGPQIMVTSMFVSGQIPFSAQLGNAISNDGDALIPAIAMAPKAAIWAMVFSTVPALVMAYTWYFIFE